jgi:hypothetical protein
MIPHDHLLVGTWIAQDDDSNAAFTFSVADETFRVSGFCRSDGEAFEITDVAWDDETLSFTARMPSTNTITKNAFRVRPDGTCDLELTTREVGRRKTSSPVIRRRHGEPKAPAARDSPRSSPTTRPEAP